MPYLVLASLLLALLSAVAASTLLALVGRRGSGEMPVLALRAEIALAFVLLANLGGFIAESLIKAPDPRLLFALMSLANLALGAMTWQFAALSVAALGGKRPAALDAAFILGIVAVYVVSVYFAAFGSGPEPAYDNRVGFLIPSILSALCASVCGATVLLRSAGIVPEIRGTARICAVAALVISVISILNETMPLARLLGVAQLPLSPFILLGMNALVISLAWRSLNKPASTARPEVDKGNPDGELEALLDEAKVEEAARRLATEFGLSEREREVAALALSGYGNAAIAERLFISSFTVKNHLHAILGKTGAATRLGLLRMALSRRSTR